MRGGHRPELADVFRQHARAYEQAHGQATSAEQHRALRDIVRCRTRELGGHKRRCDHCGHEAIVYNSCRNRHCPKCQATARAAWLDARRRDLLDVAYFHVVLTLPAELGPLALCNPRVVYGLLFRAGAEALLEAARDPRLLGAEIGILAVLHTWGQTLHHHPHLHCLIPAGGLAADGRHWVAGSRTFFLPVRVLSRLLRGKFLADLEALLERGKLRLPGPLQELATPKARRRWFDRLHRREWVVYAKPPFGGPDTVLKYLARYIHRVALSNERLLALHDARVSFRWKDYAHGGRRRTMRLAAVEFIRRFLLHVLPQGFVRIRYFGFLAHRHRQRKLALARKLLQQDPPAEAPSGPTSSGQDDPSERCPSCRLGRLVTVEILMPLHAASRSPSIVDTS